MMRRTLEVFRQGGINGVVAKIWGKINKLELVEFGLRGLALPKMITHIHGPERIEYDLDELLVICVMRNGAAHIDSYMRHYRRVGVKHFVFLDNGSTDKSIDMLRAYDGVTILQTFAPYQTYENTMKAHLANTYARGRWCLCADIDELFIYPHADQMNLRDFLGYLNHNGYTGVITQMLDMFSDAPLDYTGRAKHEDLQQTYRYYDIDSIRKHDYVRSPVENRNIKMHTGGIRNAIFGTNNMLTKVSLLFMNGTIKPFVHWHHAKKVRLADLSCVLLHYPFVGTFLTKVQDAVQSGRYGYCTSDEYRSYWKTLAGASGISLMTRTARSFRHVDDLVDNGFLAVTEQYREWVRSHRSAQAAACDRAGETAARSLPASCGAPQRALKAACTQEP